MTTTYHTDITTGAAANAATINSPLGELDDAIVDLHGGAGVDDNTLKEWAEGEDYQLYICTRDADGVIISGSVRWPDGSSGTFTTVTKNTTWLAIDAYTITHGTSGKTVTQTLITRDSNGNVTTKPVLTVG